MWLWQKRRTCWCLKLSMFYGENQFFCGINASKEYWKLGKVHVGMVWMLDKSCIPLWIRKRGDVLWPLSSWLWLQLLCSQCHWPRIIGWKQNPWKLWTKTLWTAPRMLQGIWIRSSEGTFTSAYSTATKSLTMGSVSEKEKSKVSCASTTINPKYCSLCHKVLVYPAALCDFPEFALTKLGCFKWNVTTTHVNTEKLSGHLSDAFGSATISNKSNLKQFWRGLPISTVVTGAQAWKVKDSMNRRTHGFALRHTLHMHHTLLFFRCCWT